MRQAGGSQAVSIVTRRLLVRDFREDDLADAHAFRSDPEVARFMLTHEPERPEQTRAWLHDVILQSQQRPRSGYSLAIVLQAEERVIGQIGIGRSADHPAAGEVGLRLALREESIEPKSGQPAISLKYSIRQQEWHPPPTPQGR
jgi:RimJ/RimL family protein N-acetyltransferase